MFIVLNAAVISLWIMSLIVFGNSYIRFLKEERAYEKSQRTDSTQLKARGEIRTCSTIRKLSKKFRDMKATLM